MGADACQVSSGSDHRKRVIRGEPARLIGRQGAPERASAAKIRRRGALPRGQTRAEFRADPTAASGC